MSCLRVLGLVCRPLFSTQQGQPFCWLQQSVGPAILLAADSVQYPVGPAILLAAVCSIVSRASLSAGCRLFSTQQGWPFCWLQSVQQAVGLAILLAAVCSIDSWASHSASHSAGCSLFSRQQGQPFCWLQTVHWTLAQWLLGAVIGTVVLGSVVQNLQTGQAGSLTVLACAMPQWPLQVICLLSYMQC